MSGVDELDLETHRLLLRPIQPGDADELWSAIWSDQDVTRYLPSRKPVPHHVMPRYVQRTTDHWQTYGVGVWSLRDKSDGSLVGHCGLVVNEPPDVELIYALGRSAWGRGLATEAAGRVSAFAFERRGLDRLLALVFPENVASAHVLEKLGFVLEGETERFDALLLRYALTRVDHEARTA